MVLCCKVRGGSVGLLKDDVQATVDGKKKQLNTTVK